MSQFNGLRILDDYVLEAMARLRTRYLNVALSDVILPKLQEEVRIITNAEKAAANNAPPVEQKELTAQTWFERGYINQVEVKNFEEAIHYYSEAIRLDPDLDAAYNNFGVLYSDLKRYEEAEAAYQKATENGLEHPYLFSALGMVLRLQSKLQESVVFCEKSQELMPRLSPVLNLAGIYRQLNDLEKTKENEEKAFEYLSNASKTDRFDPSWAWEDPDFQWLRDDPRFIEIVGSKPD